MKFIGRESAKNVLRNVNKSKRIFITWIFLSGFLGAIVFLPLYCFAQETATNATSQTWLGAILSKLPIDIILIMGGFLLILKGVIEILKLFADKTETDIDNKILKFFGKVARVVQVAYDWIMNNSRPKKKL